VTVLKDKPRPSAPSEAALPRVDPITRLPIITLFPHSRCNCRCIMCDIWRDKSRKEIDPDRMAGWLDEWRELGVKRVVLSGGEALLHSRLWELCEHLRQAAIGITLLSTGLLLRRHADALVRYVDDVVVSLDGPRDVHDHIRNVPGAYEKLAGGVAAVRRAGPSVSISGRCVVQRENYRELRATVESAKKIGLERISFLAADVSSEAFNRPGGWDPSRQHQIALGIDDLPFLEAELAALEQDYAPDFRTGFIAESPGKLRARLLQYYSALNGRAEFGPVRCNAPWVSTVIEVDGTVLPCFFHRPLGNLYQAGSLRALLNSPDALAFRKRLDTRTDPTCRRCVCSLSLTMDDSAVSE
jgi:Fe-coproporphyrin III synthase